MKSRNFDAFLTHFLSENAQSSFHFGIFHRPNHVTMVSIRAENTCLSIPRGLGTALGKSVLLRWPQSTHHGRPAMCSSGCPMAPPTDYRYGGRGFSLANCDAPKPQKVGDCRWTRYPSNAILRYIDHDTAHSSIWADSNGLQTRLVLATLGPIMGHILELKCNKGLFVTGGSWFLCSAETACLGLVVLELVSGPFGPNVYTTSTRVWPTIRPGGDLNWVNPLFPIFNQIQFPTNKTSSD